MDELLQVGVITSTHGLKGQVKVFPTTDDVKRFDDLKKVILTAGKTQLELTVEQVQYFKQLVIVKFKEFNSINEIEKYKGGQLFVTREDAVPLEEDEYFITDLIGLSVICEDGRKIGTLADVIPTGANDVYVVIDEEGKELLLPAIKDCILSVDLQEKSMQVHLMDGLMD